MAFALFRDRKKVGGDLVNDPGRRSGMGRCQRVAESFTLPNSAMMACWTAPRIFCGKVHSILGTSDAASVRTCCGFDAGARQPGMMMTKDARTGDNQRQGRSPHRLARTDGTPTNGIALFEARRHSQAGVITASERGSRYGLTWSVRTVVVRSGLQARHRLRAQPASRSQDNHRGVNWPAGLMSRCLTQSENNVAKNKRCDSIEIQKFKKLQGI